MSICCSKCGNTGRVADTRKRNGIAVRRRRCDPCGTSWTTWEAGDNVSVGKAVRSAMLKRIRDELAELEART